MLTILDVCDREPFHEWGEIKLSSSHAIAYKNVCTQCEKKWLGPIVTRQTFRLISNWKRMNIVVCRLDSKCNNMRVWVVRVYDMWWYWRVLSRSDNTMTGDNGHTYSKAISEWYHIKITFTGACTHDIHTHAVYNTHSSSTFMYNAYVTFLTHIHMQARAHTQTICSAIKSFYNVMCTQIFSTIRMYWTLSILHLYTFFCTHYNSYRPQIGSHFICFSWVRAHVCAFPVRFFFLCIRIVETLIFWKSY